MTDKKRVIRTTEGLRSTLFNELEGFLAGEYDTDHVEAVTKITTTILKTKDLEAAKLIQQINSGRDQPGA